MALTPEVIKSNSVLSNLTDDQVRAIATLSVNDENTVINTKIGEFHGRIEQDVKEVAGVEKKEGEKSYDYMKRVLSSFKESAESSNQLKSQIDDYKSKVSDLEQKIAAGNTDAALTQKLKDTETKLAQLQKTYESDKQNWSKKEQETNSKLLDFKKKIEFEKAQAGLKFKPEYPKAVIDKLLASAQSSIFNSYKADFVEENGKESLVFRDENGEILRNKNNALNPYSLQEFLNQELKDVLDEGRSQTGAGTGSSSSNGQSPAAALSSISTANTQIEADKLITTHLLQSGLTRGSSEFAQKQKELRIEAGVDKLPLR